MEISRAATGLLVAACVTAGAAGTYMVVRGSAHDAPPAAEAATPSNPATVESEGVLPDTAAPAEAPAPVAPLAPVAPVTKPSAPARVTKPVPASRPSSPAPRSANTRVAANTPAPAPAREEALATIPAPSIPESHSQPARPLDPPAPLLDELVVSAQSVIGLQMETAVSSDNARLEDEVVARVTRDVKVGDRVAIPSGARAQGSVTLVERGGKVRERARLGVRFTSIVLADGTRIPIHTEAVLREGDSPGRESAAKIGGGAIGGAIIGGILGGAKGAAIGSTVGAGAGTGAVMAGGRNHATLPAGTPLTVRLEDPATITVER
jgi:type IV secretory pathway VirB10-like protein